MNRKIYEWHDGVKKRRSDPMVLSQRFYEALKLHDVDYKKAATLLQVGQSFAQDGADVDGSGNSTQDYIHMGLKAGGDIAKVALHVFKAKSLDEDEEHGWTQEEAVERLAAFFDWEQALVGEPAGCPTSPAWARQPDSTSAGEKSTPSGSTATG